ncbi:RbsD/FucU family protein [Pelomonas sp. KK5]|uniref:RbsD/FucU family protein n=1 Tax=Pelomonas sp. KK5 TaxID=1855730 RepID=UPI00097BFF5D|nr:RbsD/FucU domain-containing protein [Pelomonas sp. KK5]
MLKNLDPLLTPELLRVLAAMGHGDVIAVADANFPAYSVAGDKPLIHLAGVDSLRTLQAILSVLPLDTFDDEPVNTMQVVGDAQAEPEAVRRVREQLLARLDPVPAIRSIERHAYYAEARQAVAVVLTGETLPYGNFLLRKGVVF